MFSDGMLVSPDQSRHPLAGLDRLVAVYFNGEDVSCATQLNVFYSIRATHMEEWYMASRGSWVAAHRWIRDSGAHTGTLHFADADGDFPEVEPGVVLLSSVTDLCTVYEEVTTYDGLRRTFKTLKPAKSRLVLAGP